MLHFVKLYLLSSVTLPEGRAGTAWEPSESVKYLSLLEPKIKEVAGELRKLHQTEVHSLYCSPSIVKRIKSGNVNCTEMKAKCVQNFIQKI
jgi:hypothetical protein